MRRSHGLRHRITRSTATAFILGTILVGASGADCDTTEFREAAADALGSGIKGVLGGLVDGAIAGVWDDIDTTGGEGGES